MKVHVPVKSVVDYIVKARVYSRVRLRDGGTAQGSGFTPFNTINIGRNDYRDDGVVTLPDLEVAGSLIWA